MHTPCRSISVNSIEPVMAWNLGPDYPRWKEILRDKTQVVIRPVTKQDGAKEREFIEALSPRSLRFRFLGQVRHPSSDLIRKFTDIDYTHEVAFAAVVPDGEHEKFLGVSRYSANADGTSCECAVTVLDEWHNKGLGTVLMKHLIEVARARGILYMYSIDSVENTDMEELARYLGFTRSVDPEDGTQAVHSLWLQP